MFWKNKFPISVWTNQNYWCYSIVVRNRSDHMTNLVIASAEVKHGKKIARMVKSFCFCTALACAYIMLMIMQHDLYGKPDFYIYYILARAQIQVAFIKKNYDSIADEALIILLCIRLINVLQTTFCQIFWMEKH